MAQFRSGLVWGQLPASLAAQSKHQSPKPQASQFACSSESRETRIRSVVPEPSHLAQDTWEMRLGLAFQRQLLTLRPAGHIVNSQARRTNHLLL